MLMSAVYLDAHHRLAERRLLLAAVNLEGLVLHEVLLDAVQAIYSNRGPRGHVARERLVAERRADRDPGVLRRLRAAHDLAHRVQRDDIARGDVAREARGLLRIRSEDGGEHALPGRGPARHVDA